MIQFDCPKCLQQINAQDRQAGQRTECPGCSVSLLVPSPAAGSFDDLFDDDPSDDGNDEPVVSLSEADVVEEADVVDEPPTVSDQVLDESIDNIEVGEVHPFEDVLEVVDDEEDSDEFTDLERELDSKLGSELSSDDDLLGSSDVFEDLHFPTSTETDAAVQSAHAAKSGTSELIVEEDPFKVDPDKRLEVDGVTDISSSPDSYSVKCPVCESHMFVTTHMVGTEIKCADCFSVIKVPKPTKKQIEVAAEKKSKIVEATEPKTNRKEEVHDVDVDPSFGLAPVERDLLAPSKTDDGDELFDDDLKLEAPTDLFADDQPEIESQLTSRSNAGTKKANGAAGDTVNPYRPRSAQVAKQKKRRKKNKNQPKSSDGLDFPKFEFDSLFSEMVNLVSQTKVAVPCILVSLLLAAGNVVGHFAVSNYVIIDDPTMGDNAYMAFWRCGVGWSLFVTGTILLWYFAGVIFRKTAAGERRIESWRIGPSVEWTSTFLLVGFSFAIAGSPLLMFGATWLTAPLRFFLALPMLVAVWYTQSPFQIIAVDAFSRYRRQRPQWRTVWLAVFALACIAVVSGLLMAVSIPFFNMITSTIGAIVLSFTTLGYAAVAGWHSGKVVEELN